MKRLYYQLSLFLFSLLGFSPQSWAFQMVDDIPVRMAFRKTAEAIRLPGHMLRLNVRKPKGLRWAYQSYGEHQRQYLLICEPETGGLERPAILFFHGGGWHLGRPEQHLELAYQLVAEGYTVILPGYRLCPKHEGEDLRSDALQAFVEANNYLKANGLDKPQLILGGTSAGGNLAGLLVYDWPSLESRGLSQKQIKGFFSLSGAVDLDMMPDSKPLIRYAGQRQSSQFADLNPACHVQGNEGIPVFMLQGTKDALVNYQTALSFCLKVGAENQDLTELHLIPQATHLALASQWYYKKRKDIGQVQLLLNRLGKVTAPLAN